MQERMKHGGREEAEENRKNCRKMSIIRMRRKRVRRNEGIGGEDGK